MFKTSHSLKPGKNKCLPVRILKVKNRSSRSKMLSEIDVLLPLLVPLFYEVAGPSTLLNKRFWQRCFPMNFAKSLWTPIFIENLGWLLLYRSILFSHYFASHKKIVWRPHISAHPENEWKPTLAIRV